MAMIRMVDITDRNLNLWLPQFNTLWGNYKAYVQVDPLTKYCKEWEDLIERLDVLDGKIVLVRSGIQAKRSQLQQIRAILTGENSGISGIHCKEGSTESICAALDALDTENNEDESKLNTEEQAVLDERDNVLTYNCDCKMDTWKAWETCVGNGPGACGSGSQDRSRDVLWKKRNNGAECPKDTESRSCEAKPCPVDCVYSGWSEWSQCPEFCDGDDYTIKQTRTIVTPMANGGKTCDQAYPDGLGKTKEEPCNILQIKTDALADLDKEIDRLRGEADKYKRMMCNPNPCENSGHCHTTETIDDQGDIIPEANCKCDPAYTGDRCGTRV